MSRIGEAFRAARRARGMTIREVSLASGVEAAQLSRIETGVIDPRWTTIHKIATGLGMEVSISNGMMTMRVPPAARPEAA